MKFTHVIVKKPSKSYVEGLTTSDLGKPDYEQALVQHDHYIKALEKCGVDVTILPADEAFPDSTFVEDTAVISERCAVITNPGAASRRDEIIAMEKELSKRFDTLEHIHSPGTLEGGDVLQINDHFYIGISDRTNEEGAKQLKEILEKHDYVATIVSLEEFFHLKTGLSYLNNGDLVVAGEFIDHEVFKDFNKIVVEDDEMYAANCIHVNDYVIIPKGFDNTKKKITEAGYQVIELEMSEFQKQDGGLSCLSLRFKQ